ncbi:MAG: redoxin domain-containing protein [Desulfobacula sp.]|uniref:TlpA family protein disulfide reductase n=1 Tax=Desulfobacula sp. TaxID=2593537 RepID=UPI0025BA9695|nr:redoxin family protein [Desulfobacula sp.]MCD4721658.1 redoxin domain-containing protein [Desulfobacula sp.]
MSMVCLKNQVIGFLVILFFFSLQLQDGFCGTPSKPGENLPEIILDAPASKKDGLYLGIGDRTRFSIKDVDAQLIVLEILGVYCPLCHKQRPHINRLFHRINKNADLSRKVKFLGITAGGTPMEVDYYMKQSKVPYPILPDEKFLIHKKLGQPRTPYNMVVTKDGQVLYAHLGIIKDMDKFFAALKKMSAKAPPVNK